MKVIREYGLQAVDQQSLSMPRGARILDILLVSKGTSLFAVQDDTQPLTTRKVVRVATNASPAVNVDDHAFHASIYDGKTIDHYFVLAEGT